MCGRYCLYSSVSSWGQMHFPCWHDDQLATPEIERFNIAPSQKAPVCLADRNTGYVKFEQMRWGLDCHTVAGGRSLLTNARAETIEQRVSFAEAFRYRRCLVPADGFYEWSRVGSKKQPYYFSLASSSVFAMAAIWAQPSGIQGNPNQDAQFCVLTTAANSQVSDLHHRMPVIIDPACYHKWLCAPANEISTVQRLLQSTQANSLKRWPVSTVVNRVAVDTKTCIQKIENPAKLDATQQLLF